MFNDQEFIFNFYANEITNDDNNFFFSVLKCCCWNIFCVRLYQQFFNKIKSNKSSSFLCKYKTIFLSVKMSNTTDRNILKEIFSIFFFNFNDSNYIITHLKKSYISDSINLCVLIRFVLKHFPSSRMYTYNILKYVCLAIL